MGQESGHNWVLWLKASRKDAVKVSESPQGIWWVLFICQGLTWKRSTFNFTQVVAGRAWLLQACWLEVSLSSSALLSVGQFTIEQLASWQQATKEQEKVNKTAAGVFLWPNLRIYIHHTCSTLSVRSTSSNPHAKGVHYTLVKMARGWRSLETVFEAVCHTAEVYLLAKNIRNIQWKKSRSQNSMCSVIPVL